MSPTEIVRLLAASAYQAYSNSLVGNQAPKVRAYYQRVTAPQVGDYVVEVTALQAPASWRVGRLLSITDEPYPDQDEGEAAVTRKIWTIEKLTDGETMRWENCQFIAMPPGIWTFDRLTRGAGDL